MYVAYVIKKEGRVEWICLEFLFLTFKSFLFLTIVHIESKNDPTCPECRGELLYEKVLPLDIVLKVHTPDHYKEIIEEEEKLMDRIQSNSSSTKIRMLLEILQTRKNQEKTIILTGFTAFLNILELSLGDEKVTFVRIDEAMDPAKYYHALKNILW